MPEPAAPSSPTVVPSPSPTIPSVVIELAGRGIVSIVFDLDRLAAIEDATGLSVFEILSKFSEMAPKTKECEASPSPEEMMSALYRQRLGLMNRFMCGALGIKPEQLTHQVGLRNIGAVWLSVRSAFVEAVLEMIGDQEDSAGKPSAQPDTSAPGPVSS